MTIEQKRAQVVSKLGELKQLTFQRPTAQDLHSRRPMLMRVQRQEQRRHKIAVMQQKKKLTKDISDIDKYLKSVKDYEAYLASLQKPVNGGLTPSILPIVLPAPNIVFGGKPILKRTRLSRYKRRGRY